MREKTLSLIVITSLLSGCTVATNNGLIPENFQLLSSKDLNSPSTTSPSVSAESPIETESPAATSTERVAQEQVADIVEEISWSQSPSPASADECKVEDGQPDFLRGYERGAVINGQTARYSIGFPFSTGVFPVRNEANLVALMVSFTDTREDEFVTKPSDFLQYHVDKIEEWGDFWSQNTFKYNFNIVDEWIRLPIASSNLPRTEEELAKMIIDLVPDKTINWDNINGTFIYWSPGVENTIGNKALRVGSNENSFAVGEKRPGLVWAPSEWHYQDSGSLTYEIKRDYTWAYWVHELLHEQGLNLHAPGNGWATGLGQNQYPRPVEFSSAIPAWEQWLIGWAKDSQVHCILPEQLAKETVVLTPVDVYGGERRLVVIPIAKDDVLVIESRRALRDNVWYDIRPGIVAYTVNPYANEIDDHAQNDCGNDRNHEKWAYYLFPDNESVEDSHCGSWSTAKIEQGEVLTYQGIQIELIASKDELDYVSITKLD